MTEHRPTALVQADVFPDRMGYGDDEVFDATPEEVAVEAWDQIKNWVHSGYEPIVEVFMPDGTQHTIDLERVRKHD